MKDSGFAAEVADARAHAEHVRELIEAEVMTAQVRLAEIKHVQENLARLAGGDRNGD